MIATALVGLLAAAPAALAETAALAPGFQGAWYSIGPTGNQYHYKYSGGMATYPQQHAPIAIYSAEANKTFFTYGGWDGDSIVHMLSYYDHNTGMVARPRQWLDKQTVDAHDNPVLSIDSDGYVYMFSNTHGNNRRSYIRRSDTTYSIDSFTGLLSGNDAADTKVFGSSVRFNYGQPWFMPDADGSGGTFMLLHTRYNGDDRDLYWSTSTDADTWTGPAGGGAFRLASVEGGQYQISAPNGQALGTAFNIHPTSGGSDARTNLYYLQSSDLGGTWTTAGGGAITTPVTSRSHTSLVYDYASEGRLVYLKDLNYDAGGNPVIMYLTSGGAQPGPGNGPRTLHTAHWQSGGWVIREVMTTDHNYDYATLYVEDDGTWRIIGSLIDGPQAYGTGGQIGVWTSSDEGLTWELVAQLTHDATYNHNYPRRPLDAHPDFYALWADGDAFASSGGDRTSRLYFTDKEGNVYRLPHDMSSDFAAPELVWSVPEPSVATLLGAMSLLMLRRP